MLDLDGLLHLLHDSSAQRYGIWVWPTGDDHSCCFLGSEDSFLLFWLVCGAFDHGRQSGITCTMDTKWLQDEYYGILNAQALECVYSRDW